MSEMIPFDRLPLSDNFMFAEVMRREDICKLFLEEVLECKINRIEYIEPEKDMADAFPYHGIRLDVYLEDAAGTKYDIEMQNVNRYDLERRCRYYQGTIDLNTLEKGAPYTDLPESYIIFVCNFDYFGAGLACYKKRTTIEDVPGVEWHDGSHVLMLNSHYKTANASQAVTEFLDYVRDNDDRQLFLSELAQNVRSAVNEVRADVTKGVAHMTLNQYLQDKFVEGVAEGRTEGKTEGITETVRKMAKSMPVEDIAKVLEMTVDEVKKILGKE